jgi:serine/threonine protein kinase
MKLCPTCKFCYEDSVASCDNGDHDALVHARAGTRIIDGRFRLDYLLGRGGMGVVYKCTHIQLNLPRAIKFLLPDSPDSDPHGRMRLRREALTACRIDHPNIVRIIDIGTNIVTVERENETEKFDEIYIILELLEGQTLKEYLTNTRPVPLLEAVLISEQIAEGLSEIHAQNVLYRDLKPANIMLTRARYGRLLVKIFDFGSVRLMGEALEDYEVDLTASMFVGSPLYASPENCKNEPMDERSDIYSLGIILYEMLAGHPPFSPRPFAELIWKHASALPPPLSGVPEPLADLVARSLQKEPEMRPQSAAEFVRTLRDFADSYTRANSSHDMTTGETKTDDGLKKSHASEERPPVVNDSVESDEARINQSAQVETDSYKESLDRAAVSNAISSECLIVQGTVIKLSPEGAIVDIGIGSRGLITWEELIGNADGKIVLQLKPGQKISAEIKKFNGVNGLTYLSRPLPLSRASDSIASAPSKIKISVRPPRGKDESIRAYRRIAHSVLAFLLVLALIALSVVVIKSSTL